MDRQSSLGQMCDVLSSEAVVAATLPAARKVSQRDRSQPGSWDASIHQAHMAMLDIELAASSPRATGIDSSMDYSCVSRGSRETASTIAEQPGVGVHVAQDGQPDSGRPR
eukprot:scaffold114446_cov32-Prasinocladus_malaysianus.AAC.1